MDQNDNELKEVSAVPDKNSNYYNYLYYHHWYFKSKKKKFLLFLVYFMRSCRDWSFYFVCNSNSYHWQQDKGENQPYLIFFCTNWKFLHKKSSKPKFLNAQGWQTWDCPVFQKATVSRGRRMEKNDLWTSLENGGYNFLAMWISRRMLTYTLHEDLLVDWMDYVCGCYQNKASVFSLNNSKSTDIVISLFLSFALEFVHSWLHEETELNIHHL